MAFYLGVQNNGAKSVSDALSSRGLDLVRADPSTIRSIGHPTVHQPGYKSYINHLPAFMQARMLKERVPTNKMGYLHTIPDNELLPFRLPALVVHFNQPIPDNVNAILSEIGYTIITVQKKSVLLFPELTIAQVKVIASHRPVETTPTTQNSINLSSMKALFLILRLVSSFLRTHTYPAFSDNGLAFATGALDEAFEVSKKRSADQMEASGDNEEIESPGPAAPVDDIKLYYAKPPADPARIPWGHGSLIPNCSGLVCPFVAALAHHDKETVLSVITQHFLLALGSSLDMSIKNLHLLRSAWGHLYSTNAGDVLSHMFKMIGLALDTQTQMFPLFSGDVYDGCILSGGRFVVRVDDVVYKPQSYAEVQIALTGLKLHSAVLNTIAAMCGDEGQKISDATTMRQVSAILKECDLNEAVRDSISREAVHLNFPQTYLPINSTTVNRMLDLLLDNNLEVPDTWPLHPKFLFEARRVPTVLAAFGFSAPTFLIPQTPKFRLNAQTTAPTKLCVRQVALEAAVADMETVLRTREITNNPKTLNSNHQYKEFKGGEATAIFAKLVTLAVGPVIVPNAGAMSTNTRATIVSDVVGEEDAFAL